MKICVPKWKLPSPALAATCLVTLLLGWFLLLAPHVVGMADNGDFMRVIRREGLYYVPAAPGDSEFFDYFHTRYAQKQYFNEERSGIFTSQTLPIRLSIALNNFFHPDRAFYDIRFYGGLHILVFALAVYLLTAYLTLGMAPSVSAYLIALLVVLVFGDLAYTAYFNSFYAEGMVTVTFLCAMACALLLGKTQQGRWPLAILFVLSSILLITAKQQNAPQGILMGLLIGLLPLAIRRRKKAFSSLCAGACALLCLTGVASYLLIPQSFVYINAYHAMTRGLLPSSPDPEEVLDDFGIDPQYALLNKTIYFERYPPIRVDSEVLTEDFYSRYSFVSISAYYLTHPGQFYRLLDLAAKDAYSTRPGYTGNYEVTAGRPPGAQSRQFHLVSELKYSLAPRTAGFMLLWSAAAIVLSRKDRGRTLVITVCVLTGLSQIAISLITAGDADLGKHVFLYNLAFDFVNCVGLAALIRRLGARLPGWLAKWRERRT